MVNQVGDPLDATFAALSDPTRRRILQRLAVADATVSEVAAPFEVSAPAISRHLRVLEEAGLIARRREGREHHCRVVAAPMKTASDWIARYQTFWEQKLDALARYLEETADEDEPAPEIATRSRRGRDAAAPPKRPRKH